MRALVGVFSPFGKEQRSHSLMQDVLIHAVTLTSHSRAHQTGPGKGQALGNSHTSSSNEKQETSRTEDTLMAPSSHHVPFLRLEVANFYSAFTAQIATRKPPKAQRAESGGFDTKVTPPAPGKPLQTFNRHRYNDTCIDFRIRDTGRTPSARK